MRQKGAFQRIFPGVLARITVCFAIIALGLGGGLAVSAASSAWAGQKSDKADIIAVLNAYERALNGNDVEAVMQLYAKDAVFMPENKPSQVGRPAIRQAYEAVFTAIDLNATFHIKEVVPLSPDWAFARTTSDGTIKINATKALVPNNSQELFLLQKQPGGAWKLARYAFSSMGPLPEQAPQ